MQRYQIVVVLFLAVLVSSQASASVEPAISIEVELQSVRPHEAELVAWVTALRSRLEVSVELQAKGSLLESRSESIDATLELGVSQRIVFSLAASGVAHANSFGSVELRVVGDDGVPLSFSSHGVGRARERFLVLLPAGELEARVAAHSATSAAAAASRRSRELVAGVRASGNRPVPAPPLNLNADPSAFAPESESQRAWDAEALANTPGESFLIPPDDDPCWPFIASGNSSYEVRGQLGYHDAFYGATRFSADGYPVVVETQVRYQNFCGDVTFRTHQYSATTTSNGWFSVQVTSHVVPGGPEPVVAFRATAPDVGLASCGLTTCSVFPQRQSLSGSQFSGAWEGSTRRIHPVFTASNSPYPFFFRWNDEVKSLKARWSAAGFGSGYTPFTAAYIASANPPVYFSPAGQGLVVFDSANRWIVKWVMAHEFGHQFQYTIQGNTLAGGGPHTVCQAVSDAVGFVEGFADWHGSWWETEGRSLFFPCSGGECWSDCTPGYRREGNVMAFFWDLFDSTNHATQDSGLDPLLFALSLLKNWTNYASFPTFYNDFTSRGLWGSQAAAVNTLRTVNKVTVAQ